MFLLNRIHNFLWTYYSFTLCSLNLYNFIASYTHRLILTAMGQNWLGHVYMVEFPTDGHTLDQMVEVEL